MTTNQPTPPSPQKNKWNGSKSTHASWSYIFLFSKMSTKILDDKTQQPVWVLNFGVRMLLGEAAIVTNLTIIRTNSVQSGDKCCFWQIFVHVSEIFLILVIESQVAWVLTKLWHQLVIISPRGSLAHSETKFFHFAARVLSEFTGFFPLKNLIIYYIYSLSKLTTWFWAQIETTPLEIEAIIGRIGCH